MGVSALLVCILERPDVWCQRLFYVKGDYCGEFFSVDTGEDCVCDFTELLCG